MEKETSIGIFIPILECMVSEMIKADGRLGLSDIYGLVENKVKLSQYAKGNTNSGHVRWKALMQFYSIELAAAGFIVKQKGIWHLTDEGRCAFEDGGAKHLFSIAHARYKDIEKAKNSLEISSADDEQISVAVSNIEDLRSQATTGVKDYIISKNPYEFQSLVAALLRGLGYFTPFIAPKGKDGGIDIVAYNDPLGTMQPHIKVQVKHYPNSAISVDVVRSLIGVLNKDSEVGMIVTSGSFTSEAIREARNARRHLRLIDIDEFIELWIACHSKMSQDDKDLMPITPIYFINK